MASSIRNSQLRRGQKSIQKFILNELFIGEFKLMGSTDE